MTNYRNNCFNHRELVLLSQVPEFVLLNVAEVCDSATYNGNEDHFQEWIQDWKKSYNAVSRLSNHLKRDRSTSAPVRDASVAIAAKLANTLINARQKMLDQRRAKMFPLQ